MVTFAASQRENYKTNSSKWRRIRPFCKDRLSPSDSNLAWPEGSAATRGFHSRLPPFTNKNYLTDLLVRAEEHAHLDCG